MKPKRFDQAEQLKKMNIDSPATLKKMVAMGWCDSTGKSLSWTYWNDLRRAPRRERSTR